MSQVGQRLQIILIFYLSIAIPGFSSIGVMGASGKIYGEFYNSEFLSVFISCKNWMLFSLSSLFESISDCVFTLFG